jgi:hypothetical protein
VRWEPYKPDGTRQMGAKGRWQEQVGQGDFWRWQNCGRPEHLQAPGVDLMPTLAEALRVPEVQAMVALLERTFSRDVTEDAATRARAVDLLGVDRAAIRAELTPKPKPKAPKKRKGGDA